MIKNNKSPSSQGEKKCDYSGARMSKPLTYVCDYHVFYPYPDPDPFPFPLQDFSHGSSPVNNSLIDK